MTLNGRTVLVTGAQQGIGAAAARACAAAGASVVVNYLDDESAAGQVVGSIVDNGGTAVSVRGSVTDRDAIDSMLQAGKAFGGVDLLVNNAGIFPRVDFLEMTDTQFDEVIDVNLKGTFRCSQMLARQLVAESRGGSIVNLASSAAFRSSPRGSHYVSSKAGIVGLTRATALELATHQIRVNAIAPGLTDTAQPRFGMTESEIAETSDQVPLGQLATPENVADLVVFLLSQRASHITGQTMHVNGGQYLY